MFVTKLVTAAVTFPVSLDEIKAHCRIDTSDDDALLEIYRAAAIADAEKFTGRAFQDQVWDLYLDEFPDDDEGENVIFLPNPPLIEVSGVFLVASDGSETTVAASSYLVDTISQPGRISLPVGGSWPTPADIRNSVRIRFRAGYVDEEVSPVVGEVPGAIKAAILLTVCTLYQNRENMVVGESAQLLPWAAEQLLRRYRVHKGMA